MPVPIIKIAINNNNLVGDPIVAGFWTFADKTAVFRIYNSADTLIYQGQTYAIGGSGGNWADVDLSSVFIPYHKTAGAAKYRISLLSNDTGEEYSSKEISIYAGGQSKLIRRKGEDIFEKKLKNADTNFFLTTRTSGYYIFIPEDELLPLAYYAAGMKFYIKNGDDLLLLKDHSAQAEESVETIDFAALRKQAALSLGRWVNEFRLTTDSGWSFTVVITQAQEGNQTYLKFLNSWGVYEKVNLSGVIEDTPDIESGDKISEYDELIFDFVKKNQRKTLTNKYSARTGYKNYHERMFLKDMLLSDSVYYVVDKTEYACNVSTEDSLFSTTSGEPVELALSIELIDSDNYYSPQAMDDLNYLAVDDEVVTADQADIMV